MIRVRLWMRFPTRIINQVEGKVAARLSSHSTAGITTAQMMVT